MALSDEKEVFGSVVTLLAALQEAWLLDMWYANLTKKWGRNESECVCTWRCASRKEARWTVSLPLRGVRLQALHRSELRALLYGSNTAHPSSGGGMNCASREGGVEKDSSNSPKVGTPPAVCVLSKHQKPRLLGSLMLREQENAEESPRSSFSQRRGSSRAMPARSHHFLWGWCPFPPTGTESGSFITGRRDTIQESMLASIPASEKPVLPNSENPVCISKDFTLPHPQEEGQRKGSWVTESILRKAQHALWD